MKRILWDNHQLPHLLDELENRLPLRYRMVHLMGRVAGPQAIEVRLGPQGVAVDYNIVSAMNLSLIMVVLYAYALALAIDEGLAMPVRVDGKKLDTAFKQVLAILDGVNPAVADAFKANEYSLRETTTAIVDDSRNVFSPIVSSELRQDLHNAALLEQAFGKNERAES